MSHNWPNREEWAKRCRTVYADMLDNVVCSRKLSDYATPEEAEEARHALQERWRLLGRELREASAALGPLARQPGEAGMPFSRVGSPCPRRIRSALPVQRTAAASDT